MKRYFLPALLLFVVQQFCVSQSVEVIDQLGWFETAMVKWNPVANAESYNVYYSGGGQEDCKIDDQLIRSYGNYYRADIPGLKAGDYQLKITPVINGEETEATTASVISVTSQDRSGFAFSNGRIPGAYKADGTPKDGAVIIYITENTKNSVSMDVTGANENPCVGLQQILDGFKKGKDNRPLIVRLVGQITDLSFMYSGDVVVENKNNTSSYITIEGIGNDAVADGWGIRVKNATNIEIRNLAFMNCDSNEGDNVGLQQNNDYVWVHHCDMFYGDAGSDADQVKGDGALDCKKSTFVTFSYNHFGDSGKSCLLGLGENTTEGLYITYHHNWFDHSDSRHPRVRFYSAHVYNNYYDGNSKYGVGSTNGSSVFVEGNYYRNCKYPMMISQQGTDIFYDSKGTFSGEDGGIIKAFNNYMEGQKRFVAYADPDVSNSSTQFDAFVAQSRDENVPTSVISAKGGNSYNNFDTDASVMYDYMVESPENAKNTVVESAGRMEGGDFTWTFNNDVDDSSYDVNQALKNALVAYQTTLVEVQGDGEDNDSGEGGGDDGGEGEVVEGDMVHNFTASGLNSTFYSISGNLSDGKGTVYYGGLTLTQCLKIESSTSIGFTTITDGLLTLVFNDGYAERIKVNGTNYNVSNGILELQLEAGSYTITKADVANLFFMSMVYDTPAGIESANNAEVKLYPNPVSDCLNIKSNEEILKLEIYNLQGMLLHQTNVSGGLINTTMLKQGAYLVKTYTNSSCKVHTIVKQ
nr:T9SS type A sorting domain-containing protein [uncultured Carboxylicivirga sp.]